MTHHNLPVNPFNHIHIELTYTPQQHTCINAHQ